ncbi:hypothetical protein LJC08_02350 [Methanimicrococcus sp. OttesenSCG-928-J09]|nr:hypothetical protein [Methanimicrococcus sp. OttesenSCG-928-J09]
MFTSEVSIKINKTFQTIPFLPTTPKSAEVFFSKTSARGLGELIGTEISGFPSKREGIKTFEKFEKEKQLKKKNQVQENLYKSKILIRHCSYFTIVSQFFSSKSWV